MNYIIMDLEWNQAVSQSKMIRTPVLLYGEIIQIGAIKTDDKFNLIDKIKINVRPKYYKKMNTHVAEITGITDLQLTAGETFPQAFKRFKLWCGDEFRFITWGFDDLNMFADNLTLHGLDPSFGSDYINLQLIYNRQLKSKHLQCALSAAAESLEIPLDVRVHDAFNDAYITYEICRKLDMPLGIAEYSDYSPTVSAPLYKDTINDVESFNKILLDKRVADHNCPRCGTALVPREWLFIKGKSFKTVAKCPQCGENFILKLKAFMINNQNYTVIRTIYAADEEDITAYEEKRKKREERLKKGAEKRRRKETMIKTVMFDLDGTLLPFVQDEFVKYYFGGLCKKLAPYGYDPDSVVKNVWKGTGAMIKNDGSRLNSEAFWEVFRAAFPDKPDAKAFCDEFYTSEFDNVKQCLKYVPNYKPMIERLKSAGADVVLATNPIFPECAVATRLGWVGLSLSDFAFVTHYDNSTFCKPNPNYFSELLQKIGRQPSECVMIGNSVAEDIRSAKSLGIKSFLVTEFIENPENVDISGFDHGTIDDAEKFAVKKISE